MAAPELAAATYRTLCTDFPELPAAELEALREALERELERAADATNSPFPLCAALISGIEYGATRAPPTRDAELLGLVAEPAPAQLYAQLYALCVRRACELVQLLLGSGEAVALCAALRGYSEAAHEPAADVPEVPISELPPDDEEVWAADLDDDAASYEALGEGVVAAPGLATRPTVPAPPPTRAEATLRLVRLLDSLRYAPLAPLELGETTATFEALAAAAAAVAAAAAAAAETSTEGLLEPLLGLLRDHFWQRPLAADASLEPLLARLSAAARLRLLDSVVSRGMEPWAAEAWAAVERAVRTQMPELLTKAEPPLFGRAAPEREEAYSMVLRLLGCYSAPPARLRAQAGGWLLGTGGPQLLLGRLLAESQADALSSSWQWLLTGCCVHSELLRFVARVPAFGKARQGCVHLRSRAAERVCWLWLLAEDEAASAEAQVELQALVAEANGGAAGDCSLLALAQLAELLERLGVAAGGARSAEELFSRGVGRSLFKEIERFSASARALLASDGAASKGEAREAGEAAKGGARTQAVRDKQRELLAQALQAFKKLELANVGKCE